MDKELIKIAAYIGGGVAVGVTVGVLVTRDHFKSKFQDQLEEEILSIKNSFEAEMQARLRLLNGIPHEGPVTDKVLIDTVEQAPQVVVNQYHAMIRDRGYDEGGVFLNGEPYGTGGDDDPDDETTTNEQAVMTVLTGTEIPPRVPGASAYVIPIAEYMNETEKEKVSLVYYEEDGVLADNREQMVDLIHIGGAENFFGHGSDDKQIVYVRNERLDVLFEVVKEDGSYQDLVLKIQKPTPRPIRKMRPEQ